LFEELAERIAELFEVHKRFTGDKFDLVLLAFDRIEDKLAHLERKVHFLSNQFRDDRVALNAALDKLAETDANLGIAFTTLSTDVTELIDISTKVDEDIAALLYAIGTGAVTAADFSTELEKIAAEIAKAVNLGKGATTLNALVTAATTAAETADASAKAEESGDGPD
jgi:hypothetical protein